MGNGIGGNNQAESLRKFIETTIESILIKFRLQNFEPYLANLQHSKDLKIFINDLYSNMNILQLKSGDILQLLKKIGSNSAIKEGFGYNYFALWLQFLLIDEINIMERISRQDIQRFYKSKNEEQLEALRDICYAYGSNKNGEKVKHILEQIKGQQLFKEMLLVQEESKIKDLKKSTLNLGNKSNLSNLNSKQQSSVFLVILGKIFQKIGAIEKIQDFKNKHLEIAYLINQILQRSYSIERQILDCHLSIVIFNILGIQITKNNCVVHEQINDAIKQRFQIFQRFFNFQKSLIEYDLKQIKIQQIFFKMNFFLKDGIRDLWYWPTYDKQSFIVFITKKCFQAQKINNLIQILNVNPPNMTAPIFDINGRQFLEQILTQTPKEIKLAQILKCFEKYAKDQNIDFEKELKSGVTYETLLQARSVPIQRISNWYKSVLVSAEDNFYIYCSKTKIRQRIYISTEDKNQLLDKWKDLNFYQSLQFSNKGYTLECKFTNKKAFGIYKSGKLNHRSNHKSNVQYSGIINYGNLQKIQHLIKQLKWIIFSGINQQQIIFDAHENERIALEVMKNIKNEERIFKMRLDTGKLIEINLQSMEVNQLITLSTSVNSSMMRNSCGFLAYLPAYKTQNISLLLTGTSDYELDGQVQSQKQSQQQSLMVEYKKQQSLQENFQFLGVFRLYFQINHDFNIDQNENVLATIRSIGYFKNWLQIQLYSLIDKHLLQKEEKEDKKRIFNVNKNFKLSKKLYPQFKHHLTTFNQKISNPLIYTYDDEIQNLIIKNLKNQEQSRQFYQLLMQYLTLKISKQFQKKKFTFELTNDEKDYLMKQKDITIEDLENKIVQVYCTKQEKQRLLKEVAALDQVHEFTYQDPAAYKLMKEDSEGAKYISNINLAENLIGQDVFKVSMKIRYHPDFKEKLLFYHKKIQASGGENIQQKIQNEGKFVHIYQSQFRKQNIQIDVLRMGKDDIFLQYKRRLQREVNNVLSRIGQAKQREFIQILKNRGQQHVFTNVQPSFIFKLKDILIQKFKKVSVNLIINLQFQNNNYIMTAQQILPDQQKIIDRQIFYFKDRMQQFIKGKRQILDSSKICNKIFDKIPKDKVRSKLIKNLIIGFKQHIGRLLNQIITKMTTISLENIKKQFTNFIEGRHLETPFTTKQKANCEIGIFQSLSNINIFQSFLHQFLEKKSRQLNRPINQNIILNDIRPILNTMDYKFKDRTNKISIKDLQSYFKSLNIFFEINYGQQLPITKYLRQFNQLINNNDVVLVKVGTGSGKSTLIPPYLIGLGYQKVVVTQPRRFPCHQIYTRVSKVFGDGVCGYEVADLGEDKSNSLIYMTDGLLKMKALYRLEEFDKIDVLIIDEIHERSANIDILLLLLHSYYKLKKRKLKLVLCSATIDESIASILKDANLKIATFEVNVSRHPIKQQAITTGNILSRVLELANRLEGDQQMLIFFPGVGQVIQMVNLLNKNNCKAYPIMAEQSPILQAKYLQLGQIFVATSIAQTSLTFKNLRFVVDSQMSRWRKFNPIVGLMQTQEDYSSNSSIAQRKGRLGRTCPGQYHYFVYPSHDPRTNREHNRTELENNDLTSYIYELLLRQNTFKEVQFLMRKLNHNSLEFNSKFQYSLNILKNLNIIDSNNSLTKQGIKMKSYGNL